MLTDLWYLLIFKIFVRSISLTLVNCAIVAATVDTRRFVSDLCLSRTDSLLAVVESESYDTDLLDSTVVRIYDIGMRRQEEDEDQVFTHLRFLIKTNTILFTSLS